MVKSTLLHTREERGGEGNSGSPCGREESETGILSDYAEGVLLGQQSKPLGRNYTDDGSNNQAADHIH